MNKEDKKILIKILNMFIFEHSEMESYQDLVKFSEQLKIQLKEDLK